MFEKTFLYFVFWDLLPNWYQCAWKSGWKNSKYSPLAREISLCYNQPFEVVPIIFGHSSVVSCRQKKFLSFLLVHQIFTVLYFTCVIILMISSSGHARRNYPICFGGLFYAGPHLLSQPYHNNYVVFWPLSFIAKCTVCSIRVKILLEVSHKFFQLYWITQALRREQWW